MRKIRNDVLVTTAEVLEDCELTNYQDALFATAVIGTGMISTTLSNISDTFGARSGTFERKIDRIRGWVIEELKEKARFVGSNCLIGLSFSVDEISSGQKNMFMLTAAATPVTCKNKADNKVETTLRTHVTRAEIQGMVQAQSRKEKLQAALTSSKSSAEWEVNTYCVNLIDNQNGYIEGELADLFVGLSLQNKSFDIPVLREALQVADPAALQKEVFKRLWDVRDRLERIPALMKPSSEITALFDRIKQDPDYKLILACMEFKDVSFETLVLLPVLNGMKEYYKKEDLDALNRICRHLTSFYWPANPDQVDERCRIMADGTLVTTAGVHKTISASTFENRRKTTEYLQTVNRSLNELFQK